MKMGTGSIYEKLNQRIRAVQIVTITIMVLFLAGLLVLRYRDSGAKSAQFAQTDLAKGPQISDEIFYEPSDDTAADPYPVSVDFIPTEELSKAETESSVLIDSDSNPDLTWKPEVHGIPKRYTAETYQLVTDLEYIYRTQGASGQKQVEQTLEKLKNADLQLGQLWEEIMKAWKYVGEELTVQSGVLPEALPRDESLCIVVLGYQLFPDGSMKPELQGRCETGLTLLEKYPNALLAVTGGGTAQLNREISEAEAMAQWFLAKGVSEDQIILETNSMTTGENAENICAIIAGHYPQVKEIAVVSSDYHVAQGILLFTEAALLYAYTNDCAVPYTVTGYAAFPTAGSPEYSNPANFGADIWVMADPHY